MTKTLFPALFILTTFKDAQGKVIKAVLDDEGEHYELTKVK
jgi:hypothetical protein